MSDVNAQHAHAVPISVLGGQGTTTLTPGIAEVSNAKATPQQTIKERIQLYSKRLKEAQALLETTTPHSNHEKKARAEIAKCKKKLIRLQKDLKKAA